MPIEEHVSEKEKYCANWTDTIYTLKVGVYMDGWGGKI